MIFPEPILIYLYEGQNQPDNQTVTIRFGEPGGFPLQNPCYQVPKPLPTGTGTEKTDYPDSISDSKAEKRI